MAKNLIAPMVNLGRVEAVPVGQGRCYVVGSQPVALFRQRDGRLFATHNRCPHRQGPLAEGLIGGGKVICPLHAHQFDLETGAGSEATECIQVFSVEEVHGEIFVGLEGSQS